VMGNPTNEQLHNLRIKSKYLRYTLESLREVLPDNGEKLIQHMVKVQDHLGELHDATVAADLIRSYEDKRLRKAARGRKANRKEAKSLPGLDKYLDERESTVQRLRESFFPMWGKISGPGWRKDLAQAVAAV